MKVLIPFKRGMGSNGMCIKLGIGTHVLIPFKRGMGSNPCRFLFSAKSIPCDVVFADRFLTTKLYKKQPVFKELLGCILQTDGNKCQSHAKRSSPLPAAGAVPSRQSGPLCWVRNMIRLSSSSLIRGASCRFSS